MTTTPIEITYVFDDGRRALLGKGAVDATGHIDVTEPVAGQEEYIATEMAELNARDYVILKEPPTEDQPRFSLNKRKVYRGDADFLEALKDYGMRVYAMEFAFDVDALMPAAPVLLQSAPPPEPEVPEDEDVGTLEIDTGLEDEEATATRRIARKGG